MTREQKTASRTFTQQARRAQIVQAAIETVAEVGYSHASLQRIARHAGLSSTGMISYHFAGKPELITEVVDTIFRTLRETVAQHVGRETTYRGKLGAYIRSHVDFIARRPQYTLALMDLVATLRHDRIEGLEDLKERALSVAELVDLLDGGRRAGEFGCFDSVTVALTIRGAIHSLLCHRMLDVNLDLDRCGRELVAAVDRCTQPV
ncbi:TetR/AcrR family transcriptional regulator [Streptomyces echinoruber]|jgi:AcrR family transcriptional regulator|uniref:TetR family transcriptional regulator n=1 Tax=Streptomyces echinoruber TaxID=68898 RepID=A0A918R5S3_9ACTN|nr:TetR/AcrR family transcriptional regulator [Streptomyces echinoruber]GGZ87685.1 TetR family transcriptional regulator [Streptomyces echinoruber]